MVQSLAPPDETGVFDEDFYFPLRNLVFSISRFEGEGRAAAASPNFNFRCFVVWESEASVCLSFFKAHIKMGKVHVGTRGEVTNGPLEVPVQTRVSIYEGVSHPTTGWRRISPDTPHKKYGIVYPANDKGTWSCNFLATRTDCPFWCRGKNRKMVWDTPKTQIIGPKSDIPPNLLEPRGRKEKKKRMCQWIWRPRQNFAQGNSEGTTRKRGQILFLNTQPSTPILMPAGGIKGGVRGF